MKRLSSSAWATRHHQPNHGRQLPITASIDAGEVVITFGNRYSELRAEAWEHANLIALDGYRLLIEDHGGLLLKLDEEAGGWIIVADWSNVELERPQREPRLSEKEAKLWQMAVQHGQDVLWERIDRARRDAIAAEAALR